MGEKLKSHCEQLTGHDEAFRWVKIKMVGVGLRKKRERREACGNVTAAEFAGCGVCRLYLGGPPRAAIQ